MTSITGESRNQMYLLPQTIDDYISDDKPVRFLDVFVETLDLEGLLDLFGGELVAIDGSKFQAVHSKGRNVTAAKLTRFIEAIDAKIDAYLRHLESQDAEEATIPTPKGEALKETLRQWQERKQRSHSSQRQLEASGETQISLTDPDSRTMSTGHGSQVGYHVQVAVDEKHKLIVEHEVTNAVTDRDQLASMAERPKAALGVDMLDVVADMGSYDGAEVKQCEAQGITVYIPQALTSANTKLGLFGKERFHYDSAKDVYRCPAGQELTYRRAAVEQGRSWSIPLERSSAGGTKATF